MNIMRILRRNAWWAAMCMATNRAIMSLILYAWTSQPWKTQYWLREILNKMYKNDINGLGGNDDCGQMSAWYLFSVMGFYPVCPGTDQYVLGCSLSALS